MVTVSSCVGTTYLSIPAFTRYDFAYLPVKEIVEPLLVFPEWMNTFRFTPGRIWTSPPNSIGEKSCAHHNIEGSVVLDNSIDWNQKDSSYATDTYICVTQDRDSQGKLRQFRYNQVMTMSDELRVAHPESYKQVLNRYKYYMYDNQLIHWKRWEAGIMACYRTYHAEYWETYGLPKWKGSSAFSEVTLYDYREFPGNVKVTTYSMQDNLRYGWHFTAFDAICKLACDANDWHTWSFPDTDGFIIKLTGITSTESTSGQSVQAILSSFCQNDNFPLYFEDKPVVVWNDLCEEAIDDCHYLSLNSIAASRDFAFLLPDIRKTLSLIPKIRNPKTWASLFLSYQYGLRLTVADGKEITKRIYDLSKSIEPLPYSTVRSQSQVSLRPTYFRGMQCRQQQWYTIHYMPYDSKIMKVMKDLQDWDVYPNFGNCWDLIPFSFVVDWFLNLSSLWDSIDAKIYTNYLDVVSVTRTRKDIIDVLPEQMGIAAKGSLRISLYKREIVGELDPPLLHLDLPKRFRNWAELTAIIVQKKR